MVRTIVTIDESHKRWLDKYSQRHHQSAAQTIRQAIQEFQNKIRKSEYQGIVRGTSGLFKDGEDSVAYTRRIRKEWD
jgi:hypothetical protein